MSTQSLLIKFPASHTIKDIKESYSKFSKQEVKIKFINDNTAIIQFHNSIDCKAAFVNTLDSPYKPKVYTKGLEFEGDCEPRPNTDPSTAKRFINSALRRK